MLRNLLNETQANKPKRGDGSAPVRGGHKQPKDKLPEEYLTLGNKAIGVSIEVFRRITELDGFRIDMTTADVCHELLMPLTEAKKESLIKVIESSSDGESFDDIKHNATGPATFFISHAWSYKFSSLYLMLLQQDIEYKKGLTSAGATGNEVFYWFDAFCNNQHLNATRTHDFWFSEFQNHVRSIGKVLLVLLPWKNPVLLTRSWCLWEIYSAQESGAQVIPLFSAEDHSDLELSTSLDAAEAISSIAAIDSANAQASVPEDRELILQAIQESLTVVGLNTRIHQELLGILACVCAAHGQEDAIRELVAKGARLTAMTRVSGMEAAPPLLHACESGQLQTAKLLVGTQTARPLARSMSGLTAVHLAARRGRQEVLEWLLSLPEMEEAVDLPTGPSGSTPLHLACAARHEDVARLLLSRGANPLMRRQDGWHALHIACRAGSHACVELLLDTCPTFGVNDRTASDALGETPLMLACRGSVRNSAGDGGGEALEVSILLLSRGSEVNAANMLGQTPLFLAVWGHLTGSTKLVKLLAEAGADVNAKDNTGLTPIQAAIDNGNMAMVEVLKELGAEVKGTVGDVRAQENKFTHLSKRFSATMARFKGKLFDVGTTNDASVLSSQLKPISHSLVKLRLAEANVFLETITRSELSDVTSGEPTNQVKAIVLAPLILLGFPPKWAMMKRIAHSGSIVQRLVNLDRRSISEEMKGKFLDFVKSEGILHTPDRYLSQVPFAVACLSWIQVMYVSFDCEE